MEDFSCGVFGQKCLIIIIIIIISSFISTETIHIMIELLI